MTRLVAIVNKQAQFQELVACVRYFDVDDLALFLSAKQRRVGTDAAQSLFGELFRNSRLQVSMLDVDDRRALAAILDEDADVLAVPLYHARGIYRRVRKLRQRRRIVHLTDGLGDLFGMWEHQRAVLARTNLALLKAAIVVPQLYACRADLEFNPFHPAKSRYAKRSLATGPFPMTASKRRLLTDLVGAHSPQALIIEGFDLKAAHIAAGAGVESYIASRRDGGIIVDGRVALPEEIVCAEEVLETFRPTVVVGCPSTSLAAARHRYDDVPVFCIATEEANHVRGQSFNKVFEKYGRRFGIVFAGAGSVDRQLGLVRELIAKGPGRAQPDLVSDEPCKGLQHVVD